MSKKTILVAAGVLLAAGAVAAVAHGGRGGWRSDGDGWGGHRGGWHEGRRHEGRGHEGRGHEGRGHEGRGHRFGRQAAGLTQEEWDARTRERFARLDANSDGVIDTAEVSSTFEKRGERRAERGQRFTERMLKRMGADTEGKLTRAAFDAFLDKKFAEADLNSDGKIDDADLPPMMRGRQALSKDAGQSGFGRRGGRDQGGRLFGFLRNADTNGDGVITREEVKAAADKRFANFDRTGDGTVDKADFEKLRTETSEYRVQRFMHRFGAKDGKVTREQFEAKAKEQFAMRDTDGDGVMDGRRGGHRGGRHGGGQGGHMMERGPGGPDGPGAEPGQRPRGPGPRGPGAGGAPGSGN